MLNKQYGVSYRIFRKGAGGRGNHLTPHTYQETVPINNVLTARIHVWINSRCFLTGAYLFAATTVSLL